MILDGNLAAGSEEENNAVRTMVDLRINEDHEICMYFLEIFSNLNFFYSEIKRYKLSPKDFYFGINSFGNGKQVVEQQKEQIYSKYFDQKLGECPKCHQKTLVTLFTITRSGDEGTTVIQDCISCKYHNKTS
jgi:DNA-directed RNA polymerase subunit M/transcription elongation factor TFIIS